MSSELEERIAVFSPENEPYLGRESVYRFDQVIMSAMEANSSVSAYTRKCAGGFSALQEAACQIIPQGINLALSIRELVRQGYLFAALVLLRPLIERSAVISYLCERPEKVKLWKDGWKYRERPPLKKMLQAMHGEVNIEQAQEVASFFNHILHGDPIGATYNQVPIGKDRIGYSVGKSLDDPDMCDFVCFQAYTYLVVLMGRMSECLPTMKSE